MTDNEINIFLAEHLDGYHVVGEGRCTNYEGCPDVWADDDGWDDAPKLPVFVRSYEWERQDDDWSYKEEIHRTIAEKKVQERLIKHDAHPEKYSSYSRAELEAAWRKTECRYIGGWHVHALEPVYDYTGSGHQMVRILNEMKSRGWYITISNGELQDGKSIVWSVGIEMRRKPSESGALYGCGRDESITRAVATAAVQALHQYEWQEPKSQK